MATEEPQIHEELAEAIAREPQTTGGLPSKLLMFSVSVFIISLVVYFGMIWGYEPYLNSQLNKINNQLDVLSNQIPQDEQQQLLNFASQTTNLTSLLNQHIFFTNIFNFFQQNTEANVYFNRFNVTTFNNQVQLSGMAKSINDIVSQLSVWQNSPAIQQVNFNQVSLVNGGYSFNATLTMSPKFFYQNQQQ